jgi:hypothetical protein
MVIFWVTSICNGKTSNCKQKHEQVTNNEIVIFTPLCVTLTSICWPAQIKPPLVEKHRISWTGGIGPSVDCTYRGQNFHSSSGIRIRDPSVRVVQDRTRLRPSIVSSLVLLWWGDTVSVELGSQRVIHKWIWSSGGMILTGRNRRTRRETCPSATLSSTNSTWTDLSTNPRLCSEKPAASHLSCGTSCVVILQRQETTPTTTRYTEEIHRSQNIKYRVNRCKCGK